MWLSAAHEFDQARCQQKLESLVEVAYIPEGLALSMLLRRFVSHIEGHLPVLFPLYSSAALSILSLFLVLLCQCAVSAWRYLSSHSDLHMTCQRLQMTFRAMTDLSCSPCSRVLCLRSSRQYLPESSSEGGGMEEARSTYTTDRNT